MITCLLALLAQAPAESIWDASVFTNPQAWTVLESGPLTIESRPITGTPFSEFRVTADSKEVSVEALCRSVFEWGTKEADSPGLKASKVLQDGDDERVVYNQIEQPFVSNRDYAMTVIRRRDESGCGIRFKATNDRAPTKGEGVVRMDRLWGSWRFTPIEGGGARVTYTLFADPAGAVPPFLVHGSQRSAAKDSVKKAIEKAKKK
jgi:START domain